MSLIPPKNIFQGKRHRENFECEEDYRGKYQ